MDDCRPTKRPRESVSDVGHEKSESTASNPKGCSKKLAGQIDEYHRAHDNVLRKVTLLQRNITTTTGKIRSSLVHAVDLHNQLAEWLQSHGELLSSRCCKCDDPQFRYLFADCKHLAKPAYRSPAAAATRANTF
ncbi:hypothetical protein K4K58_008249 [Colletotrichum sp. SAR11_239]|nr:hypothetical protein K4K58_008249 [Colletotrichum sp. SAR11_239]